MTTIDKTGASDAEFEARIAPFEADERVEAVARAIYNEGAYCGDCPYSGWDDCPECRRYARGYARAAIAALPPSPAEEAVKRVEALHRPVPGDYGEQVCATCTNAVEERMAWPCLTGAALASPAPAPHGEEGQR